MLGQLCIDCETELEELMEDFDENFDFDSSLDYDDEALKIKEKFLNKK